MGYANLLASLPLDRFYPAFRFKSDRDCLEE